MKLLTVLAATAVAAAVAAALSISAGASPSADGQATKIATCLRAHGAAGAPSGADAFALKQWVATHGGDSAVTACLPQSAAPPGLVACLRAHGLNPPANLFQLKPWMLRQNGTQAGKAVLHACDMNFEPARSRKATQALKGCGGTPADKPKAKATAAG
jgi:hypothetical protein